MKGNCELDFRFLFRGRRPSLQLHVNTFGGNLELAALDDLDIVDGPVGLGCGRVFDLFDYIVALKNLAEDDVAAVEPAGRVLAM